MILHDERDRNRPADRAVHKSHAGDIAFARESDRGGRDLELTADILETRRPYCLSNF